MLALGSELIKMPVMSLHTGGRIANLQKPIINPVNLRILAYSLKEVILAEDSSLLRTDEIREVSSLGVIIDSADDFIGIDDVIKIKEVSDLGFRLVSMPVVDERGHKLGKVSDYAVDTATFMIQKLYVKKAGFRSLTDTGMLIDRSQVIEINHSVIIVKSASEQVKSEPAQIEPVYDYINPFRKPAQTLQPDN